VRASTRRRREHPESRTTNAQSTVTRLSSCAMTRDEHCPRRASKALSLFRGSHSHHRQPTLCWPTSPTVGCCSKYDLSFSPSESKSLPALIECD
jgi:hypothetical protein